MFRQLAARHGVRMAGSCRLQLWVDGLFRSSVHDAVRNEVINTGRARSDEVAHANRPGGGGFDRPGEPSALEDPHFLVSFVRDRWSNFWCLAIRRLMVGAGMATLRACYIPGIGDA